MINPNPFKFSTLPTKPSPSTPMCGIVKIGESTKQQTDSLVKPTSSAPNEELDVTSQPRLVSSMMFERLFAGDLSKGKGTETNILAISEDWLVQSLMSLKRVIQPPFFEVECKSPDPVLNRSKTVFDQTSEIVAPTNAATVDIEGTGLDIEAKIFEGPSESERKKKRKRKGKLVKTSSKKGYRKYITREITEKLMSNAMVANKAQQFKIIGKEKVVAKSQKEVEEKRENALRIIRANKKSLAKKARVKTKATSKPQPIIGPVLEKRKVLNGRVFDPTILTEPGICSLFDYVALQSSEHMFKCYVPYLHEP
ncbi:hypothetical protein H5410_050417 [Solanum commersonii]|uniref:Uncharacterized protein n=1 Tax=Solanum commersonii TaxID=4109 RepID=A0A9J5WXW2_SOLCO|nr:hypothetical protein H5410_050417 [Solanum commersonii]